MPWMRRVEVIVTRKDDPSKKTIFKAHRIDFEVRSTVAWATDTANITIHNLSLEEVKFLQNKNYGDMYIEIRAGYQDQSGVYQTTGMTNNKDEKFVNDGRNTIPINNGVSSQKASQELPTLFSGIITNAVGYRRPPEHVTQIFCISKASGIATDFKQMNPIPPGAKLLDAVKSMTTDYGYHTLAMFGATNEVMETILPRGRVFHNTFMEEFKSLLGEYNLLFTITTSEIQIFPDTFGDKDAINRMSKDRSPIQLDVNQVIGNPIAGISTFRLNTFLNPAILPGMILDVSPLLGNEILANGVTSITGEGITLNVDKSIFRWVMSDKYFIKEVVHSGSTHATDFYTSISSELGGNTMMGGDESNWQSMYENSGMSMESF